MSSVKWLSSQLGPDDFSLTECSHFKFIVTDALWLLIYLYRLEVDDKPGSKVSLVQKMAL